MNIVSDIASFLWGWPLLILLLGTHIFLTIRLRFVQRYLITALKLSVKDDSTSAGEVSQFEALMAGLAATLGTGNIVGVATAIALGGPGAVFWTWMTGIFGIATKYGEGLLAVKYRVKNADGTVSGGPMYALENGLKCRWLGVLFAIFTVLASFGISSSIQSNTFTSAALELLPASVSFDHNILTAKIIIGIILTIISGLIILGGVKSIVRVCKFLVPIMAVFYILTCLIILTLGYTSIIDSLVLIIKSAFSGHAAIGGFVGSSIMMTARYGVSRGLFSNEAGMGSAPIIAAAAQTRNPVRQALVSSTAPFWDTVVVCAITGLTLVNTGAWTTANEGMGITKHAFDTLHVYGGYLLCFALMTFTFSTIISWYYYAEKSMEYLWGRKSLIYYKVVYLFTIFAGAIMSLNLVFDLGDIFNGLMAIPNLICLLLLSGVIVKETRYYLWENRLDEFSKEDKK